MITIVAAVAILAAVDIPVAKVADDAKVIDRVAQASKKDLPTDLLRRIVNEDIEQLRGHRADGTYEYASFDRFESGRTSKSFSVDSSDHTLEVHGSFVYRLQIDSPSRRMLVTRNRKVYLDHVDIDYIPITPGAARKTQSVKIEEWIDAGQQRSVDFEAIAKEATVRVFAHSDKAAGYGNLDLSLIEARVIDNADSPYADAVASAKAIQRALDHNDVSSIRAMAQRMYGDLVAKLPSSQVAVEEKSGNTATGQPGNPELLNELQSIEDLLTGTEAERREGLDRLHQLVRKLRPQTH